MSSLIDTALRITLEIAKTEQGRKAIAETICAVMNQRCRHNFGNLLWVNEHEAVCLKCGTKLSNRSTYIT